MPVGEIALSKFPVLVVDDESDNLDAFRFTFGKTFSLHYASSGEDALALAREHDMAVVVTDQRMPRMTGLELLRAVRDVRPDAIGIIVTAFTDVDVLIESINLGRIYRYVTKPWDSKELRGILVQAVERFHLLRENRRLADQLSQYAGILSREAHSEFNFGAIVGDSPPLRQVLAKVEQVAQTQATVLLRGETGTGKEMVARAIHINSARESRPFVRVNCAALAQGVLESELFGHEKGAFTGAVARRQGRFELADGGTLFLDEVGDLPLDVQVKLLRVLQEREFERVGGVETVKVDVRLVSATHRDLERLISEGKFREDLYYRLNVLEVRVPPLRERRDDIAPVADALSDSGFEVSGKFMYDINTKNDDTSYLSGQEFHFDYTLAQKFNAFSAGVGGYFYKQVTDDEQNGIKVGSDGNKGQVFAIGPQIKYDYKNMSFSFKYQKELLVENKPEGDKFWFNLMYAF